MNEDIKKAMISIIADMPCTELEIQKYVSDLVEQKIVPPCMPMLGCNSNIVRALTTINRYVGKKVE